MKKPVLILLFTIIFSYVSFAQEPVRTTNDIYIAHAKIVDGDTIWVAEIDEVFIFPEKKFNSRWQRRRYTRLIRNVKIVYPWAKLVGRTLYEVNTHIVNLDTEKERKQYIKQVEKDLFDKYEDDLRKLTISQGKILVKLVNRETGTTSYEVVKELKGTFTAFFWQAIARIFGNNLKAEYDPYGEDRLIEEIVILIENRQL